MASLKYIHFLISESYEYYVTKKVNVTLNGKLCDYTEVLEIRNLFSITQVDPKCQHNYPYKRETACCVLAQLHPPL